MPRRPPLFRAVLLLLIIAALLEYGSQQDTTRSRQTRRAIRRYADNVLLSELLKQNNALF